MNTLECNLRVTQILRDALKFGTLEQCIETQLMCANVLNQGLSFSLTEHRLLKLLNNKVRMFSVGANDAKYN